MHGHDVRPSDGFHYIQDIFMRDVFAENFFVCYVLQFVDRFSVLHVVHQSYSVAWSFASYDVIEPEKVIAYENSGTKTIDDSSGRDATRSTVALLPLLTIKMQSILLALFLLSFVSGLMFHVLCTSVMESSKCIINRMENNTTVAERYYFFVNISILPIVSFH